MWRKRRRQWCRAFAGSARLCVVAGTGAWNAPASHWLPVRSRTQLRAALSRLERRHWKRQAVPLPHAALPPAVWLWRARAANGSGRRAASPPTRALWCAASASPSRSPRARADAPTGSLHSAQWSMSAPGIEFFMKSKSKSKSKSKVMVGTIRVWDNSQTLKVFNAPEFVAPLGLRPRLEQRSRICRSDRLHVQVLGCATSVSPVEELDPALRETSLPLPAATTLSQNNAPVGSHLYDSSIFDKKIKEMVKI